MCFKERCVGSCKPLALDSYKNDALALKHAGILYVMYDF
jgi:hypothetical protein